MLRWPPKVLRLTASNDEKSSFYMTSCFPKVALELLEEA